MNPTAVTAPGLQKSHIDDPAYLAVGLSTRGAPCINCWRKGLIRQDVQLKHNVEGLFFDFDGTLVRTEALHIEGFYGLLAQSVKGELPGRFKQTFAFRDIFGKPTATSCTTFVDLLRTITTPGSDHFVGSISDTGRQILDLSDSQLVAGVSTMREQIMADSWQSLARAGTVGPINGAVNLARQARQQNIPVAIVTSSSFPVVRMILDKCGLNDLADQLVCADDPYLKAHKPSPEPYLLAAKRLGINNFAVLEDTASGALAGVRASASQVIVCTENQSRFLARFMKNFADGNDYTVSGTWPDMALVPSLDRVRFS